MGAVPPPPFLPTLTLKCPQWVQPPSQVLAAGTHAVFPNLHPASTLRSSSEKWVNDSQPAADQRPETPIIRAQAWLGAPGSDVDALREGLWVRLAQSRVHPEATRAWLEHGPAARAGVGTMPTLCFLAGVSLSLASLVCKMGTTTHPQGSCKPCCSPASALVTLSRPSAWASVPATSPELGCGSDSSFYFKITFTFVKCTIQWFLIYS